MNIAYTMAPGRGDTDLLLSRVADILEVNGQKICGTVQINTESCVAGLCDMDVKVLPDGPVLRISQSLGAESKGCRLDPGALETAVELASARLATNPDLLIVNKFGRHEAEGRGFRTVIAEALSQDIPVLVGVNALNLQAFRDFVGPGALQLDPSEDAITGWLRTVSGNQRKVA